MHALPCLPCRSLCAGLTRRRDLPSITTNLNTATDPGPCHEATLQLVNTTISSLDDASTTPILANLSEIRTLLLSAMLSGARARRQADETKSKRASNTLHADSDVNGVLQEYEIAVTSVTIAPSSHSPHTPAASYNPPA